MAPRARRCQGCGGPLPIAPAGASTVACGFCGTTHDLASARTPRVLRVDVREAVAHLGRPLKLAIGLGLAVVAATVAFVAFRVVRPITDALDAVHEQAEATREALRPLAPRELAAFTGGGWRPVLTPAPPGGWTAFDPVAGIDWAQATARAWAADAQLARIDVRRVSAEGVADLAGGDMVGYRFVSPARMAEWAGIADREVNAQVGYELMMQVVKEQVSATVRRGRPTSQAVPPVADSLPLGELLPRARRRDTFAAHPFYAGYLIHDARDGWVWHFQSLSQRASIPRVRARDGAVYPYR